MSLTTPDSIRTLQRKLYAKAKQEPAYRFYALYDKTYRADILSHAWRLVRSNGGSPGIDGVTFEAIERNEGVEGFLQELARDLRERTYLARPVRRVMIPKADGSQRPLGIPTIRDRVAQMAVKLVIEPIFEADFCDHSYGFRPKRSAHDAVDHIAKTLWAGHTQVIDADLSKYFDSIPHAKRLAMVAERIVDGGILALIKQWERHRLKDKLGAHIVRYADDFVVLCRRGVDEPLKVIRHVLERLGLRLNETKTHIVDAKEASFNFLGFTIQMSPSAKTGKLRPNVRPSDKAVKKIKAKLTELTQRELSGIPLEDVVRNVNRSLRGWVNYFHYRNSSLAMSKVRNHAEERLRTHLRKRHKVKDRGTALKRFPCTSLYERYGLYKPPAGAGWKTAHALA